MKKLIIVGSTQSSIALNVMLKVKSKEIAFVPPSGPKGTFLRVFDPETER